MSIRHASVVVLLLVVMAAVGCRPAATSKSNSTEEVTNPRDYQYPLAAGKYTVLGIYTDNHDYGKAKENAQNTLTTYPDVKCMVGLWAYNAPMILSALEGAGNRGQVQVVAFDEDKVTLQGITEGHVYGTIVQQPFVFGYRSVELLAAMARGNEVKFPGDKLYIPTKVIKKENVDAFKAEIEDIHAGRGTPPKNHFDAHDLKDKVRVAFLTNSVDDFWRLAGQGCKLAEPAFNAECNFHMPSHGLVGEQKEAIEQFITQEYQGLAISPIDPEGQRDVINAACDKMIVIAQDSDAPNTNRRFYLGTSNYLAGRDAGKLVKAACPDGGKVAIFVGKLEVLNAQERGRGVIDELMEKPIPVEYADR